MSAKLILLRSLRIEAVALVVGQRETIKHARRKSRRAALLSGAVDEAHAPKRPEHGARRLRRTAILRVVTGCPAVNHLVVKIAAVRQEQPGFGATFVVDRILAGAERRHEPATEKHALDHPTGRLIHGLRIAAAARAVERGALVEDRIFALKDARRRVAPHVGCGPIFEGTRSVIDIRTGRIAEVVAEIAAEARRTRCLATVDTTVEGGQRPWRHPRVVRRQHVAVTVTARPRVAVFVVAGQVVETDPFEP